MNLRNQYRIIILCCFLICIVAGTLAAFACTANAAGIANFSWISNEEPASDSGSTLVGYAIYCDQRSASEIGSEGSHELWKKMGKDNIIDGRVLFSWVDFPTDLKYYCVAVARGTGTNSQGEVVPTVSGYSNEIDFIIATPPVDPDIPFDLRRDVTVIVNIKF